MEKTDINKTLKFKWMLLKSLNILRIYGEGVSLKNQPMQLADILRTT